MIDVYVSSIQDAIRSINEIDEQLDAGSSKSNSRTVINAAKSAHPELEDIAVTAAVTLAGEYGPEELLALKSIFDEAWEAQVGTQVKTYKDEKLAELNANVNPEAKVSDEDKQRLGAERATKFEVFNALSIVLKSLGPAGVEAFEQLPKVEKRTFRQGGKTGARLAPATFWHNGQKVADNLSELSNKLTGVPAGDMKDMIVEQNGGAEVFNVKKLPASFEFTVVAPAKKDGEDSKTFQIRGIAAAPAEDAGDDAEDDDDTDEDNDSE